MANQIIGYNISNLWKAKTYEEWVNDFIIDIMIYTHEPEYYKVKYIDVCNINRMICPSYNTYAMYYNYLKYHNVKLVFYMLCLLFVVFTFMFLVYKFSKMFFFCFVCTMLYFWNNI